MAKIHSEYLVSEGLAPLIEYGPQFEPYNDYWYVLDRQAVSDWLAEVAPAGASVHVTDFSQGFGPCAITGLYAERCKVVVLTP